MTGLHRIDNNFQWPSLEAKNIKNLIYKRKQDKEKSTNTLNSNYKDLVTKMY